MKRIFQAGSAVHEGRLYIERPADQELFSALRQGLPCHVLAPRQIGKTSLAIRTNWKLQRENVRCTMVDLTAVGSEITPEQWYYSLLLLIAESLALENHLSDFWDKFNNKPLPIRWTKCIRAMLLKKPSSRVVIFVDEIDSILKLPTLSRDFFSSIRDIYLESKDSEHPRLAFCFLGVATPSELMPDASHTPFDSSRAIPLEDFTREEAQQLLYGLERVVHEPEPWLDAILNWTDGHPYMTLKVASALEEAIDLDGVKSPAVHVDQLVRKIFLINGRLDDHNLAYAEEFFRNKDAHRRELLFEALQVHETLLTGGTVAFNESSAVHQALQLAGIVAVSKEGMTPQLRIRNRVFASVFNASWLRTQHQELLSLADPQLEQERRHSLEQI